MFGFWQVRKMKRERKRLQKMCPHYYSQVLIYESYNSNYRTHTYCDMYCPHCDHLIMKVTMDDAKRQMKMQKLREEAGILLLIN